MFFITLFEHLPSKEKWFDNGDQYTVGYLDNYKDCKSVLQTNKCDLHEGCYDYAVIEDISEGIYQYAKQRWFFKYDPDKNGYFEIDEPECFKHLCGFAMG